MGLDGITFLNLPDVLIGLFAVRIPRVREDSITDVGSVVELDEMTRKARTNLSSHEGTYKWGSAVVHQRSTLCNR